MPLTNVEIKKAQSKDKEYVMSDGGGLVSLIKPSCAKSWRNHYSINAKKQKLSLGSYPEISLVHDRIRATSARSKVAQRISPVTERREKNEASKVINFFDKVWMGIIVNEKGFNSVWPELKPAHLNKNTLCGTNNRA